MAMNKQRRTSNFNNIILYDEPGNVTIPQIANATLEQDGKTYTGDIYGAMSCSAPDPMAFTPYADLTFDDVCSWLEANLDVAQLDAALDSQIANQINPPIIQLPLPWVPKPTHIPSPTPTVQ